MVDRNETVGRRVAAQRFEIGVPVLARSFQKIKQAAADAADGRNFKFAGSDRLIESVRLQRFGARHGLSGVIDVDRNGADSGAMRDEVRMGKAVRLAIDDELDITLRPALHVLAAMRTGFAEAELTEQRRQIFGFDLIDGEFYETDAAAFRP